MPGMCVGDKGSKEGKRERARVGGGEKERACWCMEKGGGCRGRKQRYTKTFENIWGEKMLREKGAVQRETVCVCVCVSMILIEGLGFRDLGQGVTLQERPASGVKIQRLGFRDLGQGITPQETRKRKGQQRRWLLAH